jgi:Ca-activated chloride channel family protein
VVAPRYSPPPRAGADPVPDRARITPPVADPKGRAPNPVSLSVSLQPGFALGEVRSAYHPVVVTPDRNGAKVRLQQGLAPANRDFELTWRAASTAPAASLFRERVGGRDFLLAYVTPPAAGLAGPRLPREVVLVIDNSGSMAGESMPQAKASLDYALSRLRPEDRFNVVRFDDTFETLFTDTVPANREHLARARAFVAGLEAEGGTEMLPAMRAALTDPRPGDGGRLRQVVFVTDGAIGDEQALLNELASRRGRSRVFTVGIGSAPNSYLMTRVAEIGRGVFTHIGAPEEVETDMRTLFDQIESPVLTDVRAEFTGVKADITPETLPDLYAGQPLVLAARLSGRGGTLRLTGQFGGHPWSATLVLSDAVEGAGVSKLWARRKITDAEVARTLGKIDYETADARVLELALAHGLVTELTSLVAVDRTPRRPPGARLSREELPLNLPAGWDFDALFSGPAPKRPPAEANATRGADGLLLPETATDAELRRSLGLLMVALALALSVWIRRRRLAVA